VTDLLLIRITCPNQQIAEIIADQTIEKRLAACANIDGPVRSTYRWKGVVEQAFEYALWLKAPASHFEVIESLVCDLHPYDVAAIIALPCLRAHAPYARWVAENTKET